MKSLFSLAALTLLLAGPAQSAPALSPPAPRLPAPTTFRPVVAAPLPSRPCFAGDFNPLSSQPCRKPTAAEQAQRDEFQRAMYVHGLKEKADRICRVTEDIRLFNPFGGMWASKGSYIKAAAAGPNDDWNGNVYGAQDYAHLVKDCGLGRMAQFAGHSRENQGIRVSAFSIGSAPATGGPVHVRSHTRCNSSKCWPVSSYWRAR